MGGDNEPTDDTGGDPSDGSGGEPTDGNADESTDENGGESAGGTAKESGDETGDTVGGREIYHRKVTPEVEEANQSLLRLIANLENCDVIDLPPLYEQVDHLVEHLFSEPPPPDAQAELEFSYYGYRIELDQGGHVSLMRLADDSPADYRG